jgi:putative redox protein
MPSTRVEFPGGRGAVLAARIDAPAAPRAWALFAHCFTCSKDSKAAAYIARALAQAGFGVLRFDFTGLGGSGGDFASTNFSSNVDDLVAAADWLRDHHGPPSLLVGHSLGGAAVLAAADRVADAGAVVTLGAPFDPGHVTRQFGDELQAIAEHGEATVTLAGRPFTIRRAFLDDLRGQAQGQRIRTLRRPLLVMHAPGDRVVDIDNARAIFEAALHPKSFVSLDGADHLLDREDDARFAAGVIAAWATRYLPAAQDAARPDDDWIEVAETGSSAYEVEVRAGAHRWLADEPASVGGADAGPGPYDLLAAALGACTAMTLRMYARQKGLPLRQVRVRLKHAKVHASDCAHCETKVGRIDRIERAIALDGGLDEAQRQRLLEIADKCPVHRTLHGEVDVVSRLAPAQDGPGPAAAAAAAHP